MGGDGFKVAANISRQQVWMPQPVHALATRPDSKVVAVGREDGDIELAVPTEGYRVEARVPGQKNKGLRSLVWVEGAGGEGGAEGESGDGAVGPDGDAARLFGCGLDGTVFEVDLLKLCYKNVRDAYGGAAWCMRPAAALSLLAVGCDDGTVRLFCTDTGGVEYKRSFPSTGSRVLSLAWGPANDVVFAGCLDSMIHCFDATTGQTLFDMRLESGRDEDALVWALETLSDGTVISGDSYGRVQVWDGLTGTQLQSLSTHEADVLCLCVSEAQTEIFASGCDGKVVSLEKRQAGSNSTLGSTDMVVDGSDVDNDDDGSLPESRRTRPRSRTRQGWEWTVGTMRREHTHDVKALAIHNQSLDVSEESRGAGAARKGAVLVSAGVDASLALYSVPHFKTQGPRSVEPLPPVPVAFLGREARLVLIMHNLRLDLWEVPRHARSFTKGLAGLEDGTLLEGGTDGTDGGGDGGGGKGRVQPQPHPVLRLRMEPKTEKGGHLACAAISAAGDLVAVSNTKETKLYRIFKVASPGKGGVCMSSKRIRLPGICSPPAHVLAFTSDGRRLVVAAAAGDIRVVELRTSVGIADKESGAANASAVVAAAGGGARLVHCFEEHVDGVALGDGDDGDGDAALPVSALTVSANGKWLVSASVSGVVYVFDLVGLRHHWTVPSFSTNRVVGVRFHSRDDILVCVDSSNRFRLLDIEKRRLAACHDDVEFPQVPSGKGAWGGAGDVHPLSGIAFNPEDPLHSMLLFNHRSVVHMTPRRKIPLNVRVKPVKSKRPRLADTDKASGKGAANQCNFRMNREFSSIVLVDFLGQNELLVLQNPWESVKDCLPDVLDRKQYGV
eukprot:g16338.t1